ncbi:hypothetical protein GALMADRAFT_138777 [Galerina marginata CBS 339.88]|uniref:Uncharacterized protein n=1 Tax=Galerina marginata (strain CBS 339.88) TaxID=685588 RepID=A0A067T5S7_GALM3|nr:hypothetical protein GALMADRAFT_138777 [Galerina marginata CBS 339.88]
MHFKYIAIFFSLLLPATVILAAPVPDGPTDVMYLYARAITVAVNPASSGDYRKLAEGRPAHPGTLPPGCTKQESKNWRKADNKCKSWDDLNTEFTTVVSPRVTAALRAAEHLLSLSGHIDAHVKSSFHHHAAHDDLHHWTFAFNAPICHGQCIGHAYEAGVARQGRIWDATHVQIFNSFHWIALNLAYETKRITKHRKPDRDPAARRLALRHAVYEKGVKARSELEDNAWFGRGGCWWSDSQSPTILKPFSQIITHGNTLFRSDFLAVPLFSRPVLQPPLHLLRSGIWIIQIGDGRINVPALCAEPVRPLGPPSPLRSQKALRLYTSTSTTALSSKLP